jgi:hypothetical protein
MGANIVVVLGPYLDRPKVIEKHKGADTSSLGGGQQTTNPEPSAQIFGVTVEQDNLGW